jgi:uncharacterized cofD-like protein
MKKIVVIGGGTGTFTVLTGLKRYPVELSAVVSMADDGGSTGILRDELGVLPPGDIRQCLVALSTSDRLMRKLMNYRYPSGHLKGHSFGNLLLSTLEKITGSFDSAVEKTAEILHLHGKVIPATLDKVALVAYLKSGMVVRGQHTIDEHDLTNLKKIVLEPKAEANPKAAQAILEANIIVVGPGNFYTSVLPNFLLDGIKKALRKSKAKKVYVVNLMNKAGHTDGFTVRDFSSEMESYLGIKFDYILYNTKKPSSALIKRYGRDGDKLVRIDPKLNSKRYIGADLISKKFPKQKKGDPLVRNLIRHNSQNLAKLILKI